MSDDLERQVETLDLINDELAARLARQADAGVRIETKAIFLVGFAATATQFLATRHPQPVLAGFAAASYVIAIVFGCLAQAVAKYEDVPEPRGLVDGYARRQSKAQTLADLVVERMKVFERNRSRYRRKAVFWRVSVLSLGVGLALSPAAIVQTGHHERGAGNGSTPATVRGGPAG